MVSFIVIFLNTFNNNIVISILHRIIEYNIDLYQPVIRDCIAATYKMDCISVIIIVIFNTDSQYITTIIIFTAIE